MDEFLIALLAAAGATLTGRSLLFLFDRVFGTRGTRRPVAEVWGTSILLGVSFTASSAFVWSDMGQELGPSYSWRQVIIGGLLGILAEFRSRRLVANAPPLPAAALSPRQSQIIWTCRVIVCVSVLGATVLTLRNTAPAAGERQAIEEKAHVLFETHTVFTPALVHPEMVNSNTRDPLMLPLFERHVYALLGRASQPWARIWSPLTYAGLLLSFIGIVERRVHPTWAWGSAIGMLLLLLFDIGNIEISSAMPTIAVACFHGAAVLYLWDAWQNAPGRERVRGILLASAMASSALFTRNDGASLFLIDCLSWGLAVLLGGSGVANADSTETTRLSRGRNLLAIVFFVLFAAFMVNPWMRYRAALPPLPQAAVHSAPTWLAPTIMSLSLLVYSCALSTGFQKSFSSTLQQFKRSDVQFLTIHILLSLALYYFLKTGTFGTFSESLGRIDRYSYFPLTSVCILQFVAINRLAHINTSVAGKDKAIE
ncbi:MAG: hypothetical protein DWH81_02355 [Planctomycetota bacterium]|nr:MAG: hypothetical protein DWH81_02355 [Planctomycetota bacterium]